jgi:integrase/recombinase XerD
MSTAPVVTIFVRHSADCKYAGDEFNKRCDCKKHIRYTLNGKQIRMKTGCRSWAAAEKKKREIEDRLAGHAPANPEQEQRDIQSCIDTFLQDKENQGVTQKVRDKHKRELARLKLYCHDRNVITVQGMTRELLTNFCGTWPTYYPSSYTRSKVRERVRTFLRYCYEAQWIARIPPMPKIKVEEPPTLPLTADEYSALLNAVPKAVKDPKLAAKVRAVFQLMRHSGLAIGDAITLERAELQHDKAKKLYRIVTARQKTGTNVSVPIPPAVAEELIAVANGNEKYFFWSGNSTHESAGKNFANLYVRPCFDAAKITTDGHMVSHRLRDTFAVDLLEKGVPLEEVSKLLGHESIKTTERHYAKWVKGRQDRLDSLVSATWKKAEKTLKGGRNRTRPQT